MRIFIGFGGKMVGWTRRNAEDAKRRKKWWASLSEEQKAEIHKRDEASDLYWVPKLKVILVVLLFVAAFFIGLNIYDRI